MANIRCNGPVRTRVILTWILRATNRNPQNSNYIIGNFNSFVLKNCLQKEIHDFWSFHEHRLKKTKDISVLTYFEMNKKYLVKHFPIDNK